MALTKSQANRLGDKIRESEGPLDEDTLRKLQEFLSSYAALWEQLQTKVSDAATLPCTSRLKSVTTLIEKLRRDKTRLSKVQDILGARIVVQASLPSQDLVVTMLRDTFDVKEVQDRRTNPSQGYRAVHVIIEFQGYPVEIQVRTALQHAWAEGFEKYADKVGRGIRYGEVPPDPGVADRLRSMIALSEIAHELEEMGPQIFPLGILAGLEESEGPDADMARKYLGLRDQVRRRIQSMMADEDRE